MSASTSVTAVDIGCVEAIYVAPGEGAPMEPRSEVLAEAGLGIQGDRYAIGSGTFTDGGQTSHITLIEAEAIEALKHEEAMELAPGATRRNLVTRGVALNHLVDVEFRVGEVRLRGDRLCEPCGYLEGLTQEGVKAGLKHRGGLRASILSSGPIHSGDRITRPALAHDAVAQGA